MKLSIIIVNFNTAKITLNCLKSIEKYPYEKKFEVILVDNASTDESERILKEFKPRNFNYIFIQNKTNLGFSKGNNIGLKKSKGKYKLLLNSDTELTKDALTNLMKATTKYKDAGAFAAQLLNSDKTVQASAICLPTIKGAILQYWLNKKSSFGGYIPQLQSESKIEASVMAAFLITQKALKKIGLLDERYFMYFEDLDYCRKLKKAGLNIYYVPSSKIIHYHGQSGKNMVDVSNQWRRLIPSSKIYHGKVKHYIIWLIIWIGSKITKS